MKYIVVEDGSGCPAFVQIGFHLLTQPVYQNMILNQVFSSLH